MTYCKQIPLQTYQEQKIKMLKEHFRIRLSKAEVAAINDAESEIAVDRIVRDIIQRKL